MSHIFLSEISVYWYIPLMFSDLKSPSDPKFMEAFGKSYLGFLCILLQNLLLCAWIEKKLPPHQFKMVDWTQHLLKIFWVNYIIKPSKFRGGFKLNPILQKFQIKPCTFKDVSIQTINPFCIMALMETAFRQNDVCCLDWNNVHI